MHSVITVAVIPEFLILRRDPELFKPCVPQRIIEAAVTVPDQRIQMPERKIKNIIYEVTAESVIQSFVP